MARGAGKKVKTLPRSGNESFFIRAAILDGSERAVADLNSIDGSNDLVQSRSDSAATYPPATSNETALRRLHRAASSHVVTNDYNGLKKPINENEVEDAFCNIGCLGLTINEIAEEEDDETRKDSEEMHIERSLDHLSKPSERKHTSNHERNAGKYTVIAFVNSASGGGMGKELHKSLQSYLGKSHVIDLHSCRSGNMPEDALLKYAYDPMVRVLACGGDGTCGWIFSSLDKVWSNVLSRQSFQGPVHLSKYKDHLPLAIMPLGTGNDLSRQFGWGGKFQPHMKQKGMVASVQSSKLMSLDRWRCIIMPIKTLAEEEVDMIPKILGETYRSSSHDDGEDYGRKNTVDVLHSLLDDYDDDTLKPKKARKSQKLTKCTPTSQIFDGVFCNYFSLGFDATIAYLFHHEREKHPEKFTSPMKNKLIYVQKSPYALKAPKLRKRLKLLVSNEKGQMKKVKIPKNCRAIILMNIQSYGGGNRLSKNGDPSDGLIEVIFVSNLMRAVSTCAVAPVMPFLLFKVAAQTDNVCIRTRCPLHCQVDGEPWLQEEGVMQIKFHSRNSILEKTTVDTSCGCMGGSDQAVITQ